MGLICLQGGDELTPGCRAMDTLLLDAAGGGPVAVLPLASAPGHEHDSTAAHAVRHFTALGARTVVVAEPAAPWDAVAAARLVVLPGGSPRRLRAALTGEGSGELRAALAEAASAPDRAVMGASAGAMLLCGWTVLPEDGLATAAGLGLVADFAVLPHYTGPRPEWEAALRPHGVDLLVIPERSGVLLDGEHVIAVGEAPAVLVTAGGRHELAL